MSRHPLALLGLCVLSVVHGASGQQVSFERGYRLAGLWCFPRVSDTNSYVYLPSTARLAPDGQGRPQFSFVRYVTDVPRGPESNGRGIIEGKGGAVLTFLVEYVTPAESIAAAAEQLRRVAGDSARLRGPIVFSGGRYTVISSVLRGDSVAGRTAVATGGAPVFEGNRIALSFALSSEAATLLLASLQAGTPDVSIVFDMTFPGLSAAYDADLDVDWGEVKHTLDLQAGGSIYFIGADVKLAFDEMFKKNAVRLRSAGNDVAMEALLQVVYDKLLTLLFQPVQPEEVPPAQRGGIMDAIAALGDPKQMTNMARQYSGFGLYAGFRKKELKSEGHSILQFNHRAAADRHATIVFNIGDLYRRYGTDAAYFRAVNLLDPMFQVRELHVSVDGALAAEFERSINSVTVTVRKQHENGHQTLREIYVDRARVARDTFRSVSYGWDADSDRLGWLRYDVRTHWSFAGAGSYRTPWVTTDAAMIDLYAPFERRTVQVLGDSAQLARQGVRAVTVDVTWPFFDRRQRVQLTMQVATPRTEHQADILLPRDVFAYDYDVIWQYNGGERRTAHGRDSTGLIFVDEPPSVSPVAPVSPPPPPPAPPQPPLVSRSQKGRGL